MIELKPNNDAVNPSHYKDACSLECIQVMTLIFGEKAVMWFCMCNAFKYLWRYKNKNGMEDLSKCSWYLHYVRNIVSSDKGGKYNSMETPLVRLERLLAEVLVG